MIATLSPEDRECVREGVRFWSGPLPFDVGIKPDELLAFVIPTGCRDIILDSLKDLAMDLVKDETGARVNRALQQLVAEGIQPCTLHHPRKSQNGKATQPEHLDEVYGSGWLTAGHGSVLSVWGNPGDPIVRLRHLKQPIDEVGPFNLLIDHELGMVELVEGVDLLSILARSGPSGLAAADAAKVLFTVTSPTDAQIEKARRRLERLVGEGRAVAPRGERGPHGQVQATTYVAIAAQGMLE